MTSAPSVPGPSNGWLLRAFTPEDTAALTDGFRDPATALWNPGPADGDVESWWVRSNDWSGGDHATWAVSSQDGTLLGSVSVFDVDRDQLSAEVGFRVLPQARGRGVGRWALGAATEHAFGVLGLRRVQLFHAVDNVASCRVATAAGYLLEGTTRESYRYGDGCWYDEHLHGRLVSDP